MDLFLNLVLEIFQIPTYSCNELGAEAAEEVNKLPPIPWIFSQVRQWCSGLFVLKMLTYQNENSNE